MKAGANNFGWTQRQMEEDMDLETCLMALTGKRRGEGGKRKLSYAEVMARWEKSPAGRAARNARRTGT